MLLTKNTGLLQPVGTRARSPAHNSFLKSYPSVLGNAAPVMVTTAPVVVGVSGCVGCRSRVPTCATCGAGVYPVGRHRTRQRQAGQKKAPSLRGWGGVPRVLRRVRCLYCGSGFRTPTRVAPRRSRRGRRWRSSKRLGGCRSRPRIRDPYHCIGRRSRNSCGGWFS